MGYLLGIIVEKMVAIYTTRRKTKYGDTYLGELIFLVSLYFIFQITGMGNPCSDLGNAKGLF